MFLQDVDEALKTYDQKWQNFIANRDNKEFFAGLKPVVVGWKVPDRDGYDQVLAELRKYADAITQTWVNERWVAVVHLRDTKLTYGLEAVELLQRRPGSTDPTGLDFVDFFSLTGQGKNREILTAEQGIQWSDEKNAKEDYFWLSLRFDNTEAKIKWFTVFDIVGTEMRSIDHELTKSVFEASPWRS